MEESTYSEEVKEHLLRELASMKKQSVFSLIFAIICVVVMVFLIIKLRESNRNLTRAKEKLAQQNDLLEDQKVALTNFKNELDAWRMSLLEVDSIPAGVEPEAIVTPDEVALSVEQEPVIERPTIPIRIRRPSAGISQTSGGGLTGQVQSQAPPQPMVVQSAQVQRYDLKKQTAVSKNPFFGYIIYIQDSKKRVASIDLQKELKEKGAIVPAIQSNNLPGRFSTSIKYFHEQDEKTAQDVRRLLLTILKKNRISVKSADIPVTYVANAKVSLGQLEVWVEN